MEVDRGSAGVREKLVAADLGPPHLLRDGVPSAVTKPFSQTGSGIKGFRRLWTTVWGLTTARSLEKIGGGGDFPVGSPVWPWAAAGAAEAAATRRIFSRQFICGKGGGAPAWDTGGEGA